MSDTPQAHQNDHSGPHTITIQWTPIAIEQAIERLRATVESPASGPDADRQQQTARDAIRVELIEQQHVELIRQRESRAALSSLLRGMARRVGQKREEIRELSALVPCGWCDGSGVAPEERFGRDADGAPMVDGDQPCPESCTPSATPSPFEIPALALSEHVIAHHVAPGTPYEDEPTQTVPAGWWVLGNNGDIENDFEIHIGTIEDANGNDVAEPITKLIASVLQEASTKGAELPLTETVVEAAVQSE